MKRSTLDLMCENCGRDGVGRSGVCRYCEYSAFGRLPRRLPKRDRLEKPKHTDFASSAGPWDGRAGEE